MNNQPILLITGASGNIGTTYRKHLIAQGSSYTLRCSDIKPPRTDSLTSDWQIGDLSEPEFARQVVSGVHTILHLGADPNPEADFYSSLLGNNFKATYNIFEAAAEAGVQKMIYASSGQAMRGYSQAQPGMQVQTNMSVRPLNMYGVSKCFGEATASVFAYTQRLPSICVRIGWFVSLETLVNLKNPNLEAISAAVTERDLCHLFDCCLRAEDITYAIVAGLSNNRYPFLDLSDTKALLGYNPQDDAFALTGLLPI